MDSAWEQEKTRSQKMLVNRADFPASSAYHPGVRAGRGVSLPLVKRDLVFDLKL